MNEDRVFKFQRVIPFHANGDYRKHLLEATRRQVGEKIFEALWTNRLPAVVDIQENIRTDRDTFFTESPDEILEYKVSINPVQYKHFTMAKIDDLNLSYFPKESFLERVKRWIKKKVSH